MTFKVLNQIAGLPQKVVMKRLKEKERSGVTRENSLYCNYN